ncbi:SlyX family protein [Paraliomyxa miuraensis]|uniref:SlyX family protein n=1 Tax=Paraliomyxa miuraensis TaxID=376150 RepID=UPI00225A0F97|nr:SlyX family protein [Paraliomyxa miuraensis]MCX4242125.1 SlyX family protein [Paraliomyxa miuraensis]
MPGAEPPRGEDGSNEVHVRLSELEIRSEFHARTVEDLDAVVRDFAERVARLERELKELRSQLQGLGGSDDEDEDDRP